jgi:hypothetical protein
MQHFQMNWRRVQLAALVLLCPFSADLSAAESRQSGEPAAQVFSAPGGVDLKAYVFSPPLQKGTTNRPAIVRPVPEVSRLLLRRVA